MNNTLMIINILSVTYYTFTGIVFIFILLVFTLLSTRFLVLFQLHLIFSTMVPGLVYNKGKDHRVNYTTGRNLCNGRNLVELVAVKCTTPVMEYDV